jgi:hypothetical protein
MRRSSVEMHDKIECAMRYLDAARRSGVVLDPHVSGLELASMPEFVTAIEKAYELGSVEDDHDCNEYCDHDEMDIANDKLSAYQDGLVDATVKGTKPTGWSR